MTTAHSHLLNFMSKKASTKNLTLNIQKSKKITHSWNRSSNTFPCITSMIALPLKTKVSQKQALAPTTQTMKTSTTSKSMDQSQRKTKSNSEKQEENNSKEMQEQEAHSSPNTNTANSSPPEQIKSTWAPTSTQICPNQEQEASPQSKQPRRNSERERCH